MMNRSMTLGLAMCLPMTAFAGQPRVDLCHNGRTIQVAEPAVAALLAQGGTLGACEDQDLELYLAIATGMSDNTLDHEEITEGGDEVVDSESSWVRVAEVRDTLAALQTTDRVVVAQPDTDAAVALLELSLAELTNRADGRAATYAADAIFEIYNIGGLATSDADLLAESLAYAFVDLLDNRIELATSSGLDVTDIRLMENARVGAKQEITLGNFEGGTRDIGDGLYVPPTPTFDLALFEANLFATYDLSNTNGFSYSVSRWGTQIGKGSLAGGKARVAADSPETDFVDDTSLNICSISKSITATALMQLVEDQPGLTLDDPITWYLPDDWNPAPGTDLITIRHLLRHRSGYLVEVRPYDSIKTMVESGPGGTLGSYSYTSANYSLIREMWPKLWDITPWVPEGTDPAVLSTWMYQYYVGEFMLPSMGVHDVSCVPEDPETLTYDALDPSKGAYQMGDFSSRCASGGLYMNASEVNAFWAFWEFGDVITEASHDEMIDDRLGIFNSYAGAQGPYWGHNGGWSNNGRGIQTCSLTFPQGVQATVLLNSRAAGRTGPCTALGQAYDNAWTF